MYVSSKIKRGYVSRFKKNAVQGTGAQVEAAPRSLGLMHSLETLRIKAPKPKRYVALNL